MGQGAKLDLEIVKALIQEACCTYEGLADKVNRIAAKHGLDGRFSAKQISRWVNGDNSPHYINVRLFAEALGLDPEDYRRILAVEQQVGIHALSGCMADFLAWQRQIEPTPLKIEAIALELTDTATILPKALAEIESKHSAIAITVLFLSREPFVPAGSQCPANLPDWCRLAKVSFGQIEKLQPAINKMFPPHAGRTLTLSFLEYCQVPTLHGLKASGGGQHRYYLTECSPLLPGIDSHLDWGGDKYAMIRGDTKSSAEQVQMQAFDNRFVELSVQAKLCEGFPVSFG